MKHKLNLEYGVWEVSSKIIANMETQKINLSRAEVGLYGQLDLGL